MGRRLAVHWGIHIGSTHSRSRSDTKCFPSATLIPSPNPFNSFAGTFVRPLGQGTVRVEQLDQVVHLDECLLDDPAIALGVGVIQKSQFQRAAQRRQGLAQLMEEGACRIVVRRRVARAVSSAAR